MAQLFETDKGRYFSVSPSGWIQMFNPPFVASLRQLDILSHITSGMKVPVAAKAVGMSKSTTYTELYDLQTANGKKTIQLLALAYEAGLLNPFLIIGLKETTNK